MSQKDTGADKRDVDDDEFLVLDDDAVASPEELGEPWLLLIVDDDRSIHEATEFALHGFRFAGRPLSYLNAYSAAEAREVLACNPGIACALVDVVMEHEHAGLELVGYIRQTLHNSEIRLILRTGQPGYAPEISVIQNYDINDYKEKSFVTGEQLVTSVTAALRSYQQIRTIQENRRGLERVIEASARLLSNCEIERFAGGILTQTAALLHTPPDGIVCVATPARQPGRPRLHVYAAAGSFSGHSGGQLDDETYDGLAEEVAEVLATRRNLFKPRISCLYVPATRIGEVVVVIRTMAPIGRLDRKLLELFCINIAVGLDNSVMVQRIENLAYVDQLTGLPNVVTLVRHMAEELEVGREYLLGLVSIDHFEAVNDGLGRDVGDYVLRHVGQQLRQLVHPSLVARAGGGVFAFVHPLAGGEGALELPRRVCTTLRRTLPVANAYVAIGVTVGAARFTPDGSNPSAIIANAGVALKNARQARLGSFLLFEEAMNAELRALLHLTARMHKAIEERAFFLVYQPQVSLLSGRVVGVEALVRWRDGNQVVPPDQFIAAAESSGLILPLGRWVLEAALGQQRQWRDLGLRVRVAVNVSTRQLIEDEGFVDGVREALAAQQVDPGDLELEVTETLVISDMESGIGRLRQLREMGVQIAIDDFGTGYSSLGQLRHLPVNRLKIDKVFVQGLATDLDDFHIAELIVRMGQSLGLSVLAEGVETAAQRDILEDLHCDEVQGYLYARPAGPDELLPVLRRLGVGPS